MRGHAIGIQLIACGGLCPCV